MDEQKSKQKETRKPGERSFNFFRVLKWNGLDWSCQGHMITGDYPQIDNQFICLFESTHISSIFLT